MERMVLGRTGLETYRLGFGGIPIHGADGQAYEVRNRVTLCRCGRSANKPYCDGAHAAGT